MSANFPPGVSDNGVDTTGHAGISGRTASAYDETRSTMKQTGASLRSELATLKDDLDNLLGRASSLSERELGEAYARMMTKFSSLRFAAKGMAVEARQQLTQGVDRTSEYVKDKPLQSVAIASGIGMVLGLLLGRR